jgi:hypothetical protein
MRKILAFVALTAFAAVAMGLAPALASPSIADILSANHAAAGGTAWTDKATLKADYTYKGQGLTGKVQSLTDLKTPRYTDSYQIGPLSGANGFDGHQVWAKDPSGTVDVKAGGDARQLAVNNGYRNTHAWWQKDYDGATIKNDGVKKLHGRACDVLSVTPKGGKPFEAWFDAKTHLLVRVVEKQGSVTYLSTMSDFRRVDGVMLPGKVVTVAADGKNEQTQTLTKAEFLPPQPDSAYAMPKVKVSDYRIEGGGHETTIPFKLINNHIYGEAMVNGHGPYQFIFDTGGVNLVTPATAKTLGLKSEGDMQARGAGTSTMKASFTKVKALRVGGATIENQPFIEMPLNALADIEGVPLPGMVGFATFRRFVTRIDYGARTVTLIDPKHFDAKTAGTAIAFTLNGRIPEIKGGFEGIPATFDIDTGSRAGLTLTRPFAEKHDLKAKHPKGLDTTDGWGIGGPSTGYVTRGKVMTMGGVTIPGIVVSLANQKQGAFAGSDYSGNIGGGILKRFIVTFDYHNKVMYLKPVKGPVADLDTYDRAGMWFNESADGFKIADVTKNTPADKAGLKKDDTIVAVDGTPTAKIKLYDLRRRLRDDAPGTVVDFTVKRGGKTRDVKVTLKNLI